MLFRCLGDESVLRVLAYMGCDYIYAPYFYVNLKRYGVADPHVKVWVDEQENDLCGIYLMYYDTLHFFTKDARYSSMRFLDTLTRFNPKVIFVTGTFGDRLREGGGNTR